MLVFSTVSLCAFSAQTPPLTVCVGARCWRNGAGMFVDAAQRIGLATRSVGCSGVCPQGAVSACEGPECPGPPLLLKAIDAEEAETVLASVARTTTPRACMGDSDEVLDVKYAIAVAVMARDGMRLAELVDELEPLCEVCSISIPRLSEMACGVPTWSAPHTHHRSSDRQPPRSSMVHGRKSSPPLPRDGPGLDACAILSSPAQNLTQCIHSPMTLLLHAFSVHSHELKLFASSHGAL